MNNSDFSSKQCKVDIHHKSAVLVQNSDQVDKCDLHKAVFISGLYNFQSARIPIVSDLNINFWRSRLADYDDTVVCEYLEFGWPINYCANIQPISAKHNHSSATNFPEAIEDYIRTELKHRAIIGPFDNSPFDSLTINALHTVPKKGSDESVRRIVLDLSYPREGSVNAGIPGESYLDEDFELQYPSVDTLAALLINVGANSFMYKRDLSRAYRQLPVDPSDYQRLGFKWNNKIYFDTFLPFGLRTAAQACQRTTNALTFIMSKEGYSVINYVDDFAGVEATFEVAEKAASKFDLLVKESGLIIAEHKSVQPCHSMVFLGILFDSNKMSMAITENRICDIRKELAEWMNRKRVKKKELQSLVGKLNFLAKCCKPGRVFMSRLISALRGLSRSNHHVYLNKECRKDILWWRSMLPHFSSVQLIKCGEQQEFFSTDACLLGGGGVHFNEFFTFTFPEDLRIQATSVAQLEFVTVIIAVKLWASTWKGSRLVVKCDNISTVQVINSGRASDSFMQCCARELIFLQCKWEFELLALHSTDVDNRLSDLLCKVALDSGYMRLFMEASGGQFVEKIVQPNVWHFSCDW